MTPQNILHISNRNDFRDWLIRNSAIAKECWIAVKRGKTPPVDALWYLDAVEEALCFGWIDSTVKNVDGVTLQRFGPRTKKGRWTELNKERCRRLRATASKFGFKQHIGQIVVGKARFEAPFL